MKNLSDHRALSMIKINYKIETKKYFNKISNCLTYSYKFADTFFYEGTFTETETGCIFHYCRRLKRNNGDRFFQNFQCLYSDALR